MLNRPLMFRGHNRDWYALKAHDDTTTTIMIYDEISWWGVTADRLVADLQGISTPNIKVRINSPGGDVFDAIAIANALREHSATVNVQIDSLAASAATIIALAGDTVNAYPNSFYMIHNPWTMALGESKELRKAADLLDQVRDTLINDYRAKAGEGDDWAARMDEEKWYSADEALKVGLIDEILTGTAPAAKGAFNLSMFSKVPPALLEKPVEVTDPPEEKTAPAPNFAAITAARNRKLDLLLKEV